MRSLIPECWTSCRTPLHDPASFAENIPNLLRQIEIAVAPDEEQDDTSATDFSAEDAREELERLRKDEQPTAISAAGGLCVLPAQVPKLPDGLSVTPEMKQLLSALLTSSKKRIGFCGMGGIGKTTISTWLVREEGTRKQFEQIVWLALGQEPNLEAQEPQQLPEALRYPGQGPDLEEPEYPREVPHKRGHTLHTSPEVVP